MNITFPNNPTDGQEYLAANGVTYIWEQDNNTWVGAFRPSAPTGATGPIGYTGSTGTAEMLVSSNLTLYVSTAGNDTTGTGSSQNPWATPHRAMGYLGQRFIKEDTTVTVNVADGTYNFTTPLNLNHPQGHAITFMGSSTTGTRPTSANLNGGGVRGNTTATNSANLAVLNAFYNTKWNFVDCHGLVCASNGGVTVDKILITGNATENPQGNFGVYAYNGGIIRLGPAVAVHGFDSSIIVDAGVVLAPNVSVTNAADYGLYSSRGGYIFAPNSIVTNIGVHGIYALDNGTIDCEYAYSSNNNELGILSIRGGTIIAPTSVVNNNNVGAQVAFSGSISAPNSEIRYNTNHGATVEYGGTIDVRNTNLSNNGYAMRTSFGGEIYADGCIADNSGLGTAIYTNYGGTIWARNASASNNAAGSGIGVFYSGVIYAYQATANSNRDYGLLVTFGGTLNAEGATARFNGAYGANVSFGGSLDARNANCSNNGWAGIGATHTGVVYAEGATATGNNTANQGYSDIHAVGGSYIYIRNTTYNTVTPAVNTVGNGNAYVQLV